MVLQEDTGLSNWARVVIHIDFDSYYTQVEMKRLGIPQETPCAVQQWEGLIAVNYPARARGITRHMRVKDAKKACPELVLVHVETIGADGSNDGGATGGAADAGGSGSGAAQDNRRLTQKACLERYRRSTAEVLFVLHRLAPAAVIEKASIDEVYMDLTAMVDAELQDRPAPGPSDAFAWGSVVVGGPLDVSSQVERRLAEGARIACRLRGALLEQTGYTASAGIACNKLLAKIGSALHKPNQQTCIPPRSAQQVMQDLPLGKLRGFGGKLGEQLEALGCSTAGQVQALPHATLAVHFGAERAAAIEQAVWGVSHEAVQERERPKSMLAAKSFNATSDLGALQGWFAILAQELAARMATDEAQYRRRPKNLVVHYRGGGNQASERSKSCPMPRPGAAALSADVIADAAFALFRTKGASEALPCSRLAISAADFAELPAANGSAITRFFAPKAAAAAAAPDPAPAEPGDSGGTAADGGGCRGQGAEQEQEQQQQWAGQQHRQGPARGTTAGSKAGSISTLFERAQKRQRLSSEQPGRQEPARDEQQQQQQQQQQRQQSQQQQQQQQPGLQAAAGQALHGSATAPSLHAAPRASTAAAAAARAGGPVLPQATLASPPAAEVAQQEAAGLLPSEAGEATAGAASAPEAPFGTASDGTACGAAVAADADVAALAEVDVEEQRRILKELELLQRLNRSRPAGAAASQHGRPASSGKQGRGGGRGAAHSKTQKQAGPKQPGISAFFSKSAGS